MTEMAAKSANFALIVKSKNDITLKCLNCDITLLQGSGALVLIGPGCLIKCGKCKNAYIVPDDETITNMT